MVCKKYQVYDWFRTLDGAKRIDFLNGMLHLCFPLELRFLGSCIEELARKDYNYLRDAELKANTPQEIQQMRDVTDKVTRSKMIVTLALLASNNCECAKLLYDLLNVDFIDLLDNMRAFLDEKIADEFLLLLTMAANHPAFDFQMKSRMSQLYLCAEQKLKQSKVIVKESESDLCLCGAGGEKNTSQKEEALTEVDIDSSQQQQQQQQTTTNDNENELNKSKTTINEINNNNTDDAFFVKEIPVKFDSSNNGMGNGEEKAEENQSKEENESEDKKMEEFNELLFIESINFEGGQTIKGTDNYKFIIKIQWSDKTYNVIDKTYSELCEFNKQLINLYPRELNGLMETCQLVFKENQKEDFVKEFPLVAEYCSKIAGLPKVVTESSFLRSFFYSNLTNSSIAIANDSNSPNRNRHKSPPSDAKQKQADSESKTTELKLQPEKLQFSTELSSSSESSTSTLISTESQQSDTTSNVVSTPIVVPQPVDEKLSCAPSKVRSTTSAVVSVANVIGEAKRLSEQLATNSRSNSIGRAGSISQQQILPPPQQIPIFPAHIPPAQTLHLQAFQPITNMIISSPPCASPNTTNPHSLNNSRSNSPWMMMMPPPSLPQQQQQQQPLQFTNIPSSQSAMSAQVFPHHHTLPMRSSSANKIKEVKHHLSHYAINAQEELLLRYALDNNSFNHGHPDNEISTERQIERNKISNINPNLKKNKKQQSNNGDTLLTTTTNGGVSENYVNGGTMSPKLPSSSTGSANVRSSSSCSSSSYQTPPPQQQQQQQQPVQQLPLPLHLQQTQLPSPSQPNQPTFLSYNPFYQQQQQQQQQLAHHHHLNHHPSAQPNSHLIPFANPQLIAFQQSAQHGQSNTNSPNSQIHTQSLPSLYFHPSNNFAPIPITIPPPPIQTQPPPQQQQQQQQQQMPLNFKAQSKQFRNIVSNERPKSPSTLANPATSEDEAEAFQSLPANSQNRSNSISSGNGRLHRKSVSNSAANLKNNNRQHNSHSVSSNSASSKLKVNPVSPQSQGLPSPSSGQARKDEAKSSNLAMNESAPMSPGVKQRSIANPLSPTSAADNNGISLDSEMSQSSVMNQPEVSVKERSVGPYSSSSSSSSSSISTSSSASSSNTSSSSASSNTTTTTLAPSIVSAKSPPAQATLNNPQVMPPHPAQQQQQQAIPMNTNGFYYSPVVQPFTIIETPNLYGLTLPNGGSISMNGQPTGSNQQQQQQTHMALPPHQFNPFAQMPMLQAHHLSHQPHLQRYDQAQTNGANPSSSQPYLNLIPIGGGPLMSISQPPPQGQPNNNIAYQNCPTPTPGSSPNPVAAAASSSSTSSNQSNSSSSSSSTQIQIQPSLNQPPQIMASALDQQVINQYNFHHMMAILAATNQQPQQQQQQQNGLIGPNMVMMMNQQPPPQMSQQANMINPNGKQHSFQHFQPYRSQTPNSLQQQQQQQQPSPSINSMTNNNNSNGSKSNYSTNRKKSCYNCGAMNHTAAECKEPSFENSSQINQFRLNFKTTNVINGNPSSNYELDSQLVEPQPPQPQQQPLPPPQPIKPHNLTSPSSAPNLQHRTIKNSQSQTSVSTLLTTSGTSSNFK